MEIKLTLKTKILLIFLGLLSSLLFLELGLRLGGYLIIKSQDMNNKAAAKKPGGYRILCIGESTTAGQYTKFLGEALNKKCSTIRFTVIDKGRGATNTSVLLSELPFNIEYYHPDMVVAMMGVNDSGYNMVCEKQSVLTGLRVYKLCRLILLHFRSSYGAIQLVPWRKPVGRSNRSYHVHKTQRDMDAIDQCDKFILSNDIAQTENGLRSLTVTYPDVCRPYIDLAKLYFRQGRPDKADGTINMIKKEYLKDNDDCVQLLMYYAAFGKEKEVVRTAHELIKEKPELAGDHRVYLHLGNAYQSQGRHAEAERAYRKSLEIAGDDADILAGLGEACWLQGKNTEAEQVFRKALQLDPADPRVNGIMGAFYLDAGRTGSAEEYFKKVEGSKADACRYITSVNYKKAIDYVTARDIKMVCMQYPIRNLEQLKSMVRASTDSDAVLFVDNENIFKDAVKKEGFHAIFRDRFAGDFGHCTDKGNRLLAENLAAAIIQRYFAGE